VGQRISSQKEAPPSDFEAELENHLVAEEGAPGTTDLQPRLPIVSIDELLDSLLGEIGVEVLELEVDDDLEDAVALDVVPYFEVDWLDKSARQGVVLELAQNATSPLKTPLSVVLKLEYEGLAVA